MAGRQLLVPDLHGLYVVSATVTIGGTPTALAQSYVGGTYVGVAVCTQCHGGGLAEALVTPWSKTAHASVFTDVINGTAIAGDTESASCAACHTVGYDANSTVNDGGQAVEMGVSGDRPGGQFPSHAGCPAERV